MYQLEDGNSGIPPCLPSHPPPLPSHPPPPPPNKYCITVKLVMLTRKIMLTNLNLTSGMGCYYLLFLPRNIYITQHLYHATFISRKPLLLLHKQHHHQWTTSSIPTVHSVSPKRGELYLAIVPQVLFLNLRDNITKARYQTLDTT